MRNLMTKFNHKTNYISLSTMKLQKTIGLPLLATLTPLLCPTLSAQTPKAVSDTLTKTEQLKEVTVTANKMLVTPDKTIIRVSNNVRRHSYDGYSALSLMAIPGLDVDTNDGSVSTYGNSVLLCINGIEADKDEIKTLNPKDIKQVDFYTNFDPNHPDKQYVIDFIMKIRDHGGAVMLRANEELNRASGGGFADWRTFRGRSEFGVYVSPNATFSEPKKGTELTRTMIFDDATITKTENSLPSKQRSANINGKLSFLHRFQHGTLKTAVSLRHNHDRNHNRMTQDYSNTEIIDRDARNYTNTDRLTPSLNASYDHKFANNWKLGASLSGNYSHSDGSRAYDGEKSYLSDTKENYVSFNPRLKLTMPMGKIFTPYIMATFYHDNSRMTYTENGEETRSRLISNQTIVEAGTNAKIGKNFSFSMRLQERVMGTNSGSVRQTHNYFTPAFSASYRLPRNNRIALTYSMGVLNPQLSWYSTDRKRIDEYLIRVGNPELKIQKIRGLNLSFTSIHKWGALQFYSEYTNVPRAIYLEMMCDNAEQVYIQTFKNGRSYETLSLVPGAQINILPETLILSASVNYTYSKSRAWADLHHDDLHFGAKLQFMHRGFNADIKFVSPYTTLSNSSMLIRKAPRLDLTLGYALDNWSFNIMSKNPFMKTYSKETLSAPGFQSVSREYRPFKDYNFFSVSVVYRFNYGKKHKFEDVKVNDNINSGILDH